MPRSTKFLNINGESRSSLNPLLSLGIAAGQVLMDAVAVSDKSRQQKDNIVDDLGGNRFRVAVIQHVGKVE